MLLSKDKAGAALPGCRVLPSPRDPGYGDMPWVAPSLAQLCARAGKRLVLSPVGWGESPKGQASRLHSINPTVRWRRGQFFFISISTYA